MLKIKYVKHSKIMKYFIIIILILFLFLINRKKTNIIIYDESTYFTTWATAIYSTRPPSIHLNKNSLRQIVKVSASGEKIRVKFSNILGKDNLEIKKVCIADLISNNEVNVKEMKFLTFKGRNSVVIRGGEEIYSDTIFYPLKALSEVAISIYFGSVPKKLSGHLLPLTYSYIEKGNKINKKIFSRDNRARHWYFISAIEVSSESPKKTIVCFGDSITDGVSGTGDARNNYPDILSERLHKNKETSDIAVINKGIDGNRLTLQGIERYERDVLDIKGVAYIMFLFGVNDINGLNANSDIIISTYKQVIQKAHERNIFIYAGTILPFALYRRKHLWNKNKEKARQEVNSWIRKTKPEDGGFDAFFDYDLLLKDPKNETILKDVYDCGDGIHPSLEGYKKMVDAIKDLKIFTKKPNFKSY